MPEFLFDNENLEARELREMSEYAAEYRALPLRSIAGFEAEGKVAILDCGHRKAIQVSLLVGETVRCRDCYDDEMKNAQSMMERF